MTYVTFTFAGRYTFAFAGRFKVLYGKIYRNEVRTVTKPTNGCRDGIQDSKAQAKSERDLNLRLGLRKEPTFKGSWKVGSNHLIEPPNTKKFQFWIKRAFFVSVLDHWIKVGSSWIKLDQVGSVGSRWIRLDQVGSKLYHPVNGSQSRVTAQTLGHPSQRFRVGFITANTTTKAIR